MQMKSLKCSKKKYFYHYFGNNNQKVGKELEKKGEKDETINYLQ